jgi:hypothetical protein
MIGNHLISYSLGSQITKQPAYHLAFASIGANLLESRYDCWAKIRTVRTNQEMKNELTAILNYLKIPVKSNKFDYQQTQTRKTMQYETVQNFNRCIFTLQTTDNQTTYLLITIMSPGPDKYIQTVCHKMQKKTGCQSYFSYRASIKGSLDQNGKKELLGVLSRNLKIVDIEYYENNNTTSISGFSPKLSSIQPAKAGSRLYNVQAAINSDPRKGESYIYLGFPLLLNDY